MDRILHDFKQARRDLFQCEQRLDFQPAPNPGFMPEILLPVEGELEEESAAGERGWVEMAREWSIPAAVALAALIFLVRYLPRGARRLRDRLDERRQRYANSEAAAFDRLCEAFRAGNGRDSLRNFYRWLDRITPAGRIATLREIALSEGDDASRMEFERLEAGLSVKMPAAARGLEERPAFEFVARARRRMLRRHRSTRCCSVDLPDLNP